MLITLKNIALKIGMKIFKFVLEFIVVALCSLIVTAGTAVLQTSYIFLNLNIGVGGAGFIAGTGVIIGPILYFLVLRKNLSLNRLAAIMVINLIGGLVLCEFFKSVLGGEWWVLLPFSPLLLIPISIMIRMIPED